MPSYAVIPVSVSRCATLWLSGKTDFALSVKNSGYAMHAEWGANAAPLDGEPRGISASGAEAAAFPSGMVDSALFIERPSAVNVLQKVAKTSWRSPGGAPVPPSSGLPN